MDLKVKRKTALALLCGVLGCLCFGAGDWLMLYGDTAHKGSIFWLTEGAAAIPAWRNNLAMALSFPGILLYGIALLALGNFLRGEQRKRIYWHLTTFSLTPWLALHLFYIMILFGFEWMTGNGYEAAALSVSEALFGHLAWIVPVSEVLMRIVDVFLAIPSLAFTIVIASMLRRWEGVLAASTGHVAAHEAGAIEFTGHKVIGLPHTNGKLDAGTVEDWCRTFYADGNMDHLVFPGMVYISHPSEYGTLYTKAELEALSAVCHTYHMPLFMDGARLGYGLVSEGTDVTLADIARLTDVFYIGGTKVGALCGEAVVFPHGAPAHFMTMVKQQGALLAKGRLMGLQFDVLFTDGLYTEISKNAIETAAVLKKGLAEKGYQFFMDSPTNQIFVVFPNAQLEALEGKAKFGFWEKYDDTHTVMRIATSWATRMEEVRQLLALL